MGNQAGRATCSRKTTIAEETNVVQQIAGVRGELIKEGADAVPQGLPVVRKTMQG